MRNLELSNQKLRLTVLSDHGAIFERFEVRVADTWHPVFEPARYSSGPDPTKSAFFAMLPWCNRLSANGVFGSDGFHAIDANWHTTSMPVHGCGWLSAWTVSEIGPDTAHLVLAVDQCGPYRFTARIEISLTDLCLHIRATVVNQTGLTLPFGAGFHPYFPRRAGTLVQFRSDAQAGFDEDGLPTAFQAGQRSVRLDLHQHPPQMTYNALFRGARDVTILQPSEPRQVRLNFSEKLSFHQIWAPAGQPFFCIEPLTHAVDAFSSNVGAADHFLAAGESLSAALEVAVSP